MKGEAEELHRFGSRPELKAEGRAEVRAIRPALPVPASTRLISNPLLAASVSSLLLTFFLSACTDQDRDKEEESAPAAVQEEAPEHPTFTEHIAPILFDRCATCHRPGESAPFDLLTLADASKRAEQIVEVTQSRYMPPWLPAHGFGDFVGERRLTKAQIETIRRWHDQGSPEGDSAHLPPTPEFVKGWQLGEPDLVVEMPEAYTLPAEGRDVYRNFVIDVPLTKSRWVEAIEFRPGNSRAIHHAFVLVDEGNNARTYDSKDPAPGYDGMDVGIGPSSPGGHFISWQPGKVYLGPQKGMAWKLRKGARLVLQIHMQITGKPEQIQSKVGLHFTDVAPTRTPFKIVLNSTELDIPAGHSDHQFESSYRLPVDVTVLGVIPHAHYLGKALHGYAKLPDGSQKWLIKIDDWDFNWQGDYRYAQPVFLPAGSVITQRFSYDNSAENPRNPNSPPVPVVYGPETSDEMGELWLQVLPKNAAAYTALNRDYGNLMMARNLLALQGRIAKDPSDVSAYTALGKNLFALGQREEAITRLDYAISLDPNFAEARYIRGVIHAKDRQPPRARAEFDACIKSDPEHLGALNGLGNLFMSAGQFAEARRYYLRAENVEPDNPSVLQNLGDICLRMEQPVEALEYLQRARALRPNHPRTIESLQRALKMMNRDR